MENFVTAANSVIWSKALIYLLLLAGIYFSFRMRFFQVRLIKDADFWEHEYPQQNNNREKA